MYMFKFLHLFDSLTQDEKCRRISKYVLKPCGMSWPQSMLHDESRKRFFMTGTDDQGEQQQLHAMIVSKNRAE